MTVTEKNLTHWISAARLIDQGDSDMQTLVQFDYERSRAGRNFRFADDQIKEAVAQLGSRALTYSLMDDLLAKRSEDEVFQKVTYFGDLAGRDFDSAREAVEFVKEILLLEVLSAPLNLSSSVFSNAETTARAKAIRDVAQRFVR